MTYALEDGPAKIWEPWRDPIVPQDLADLVADSQVTFVAHNSAFDRLILLRCLGLDVPVERWMCTMAMASAHGLPGSLEKLGEICGLTKDQAKLTDDKGLIDTFCVPQRAANRFIEPWEMPNEWTTVLQLRGPRHRSSPSALSNACPPPTTPEPTSRQLATGPTYQRARFWL